MALLLVFISLSYSTAHSFTNLNDCLITSDIGKYVYSSEYSRLGNASGVVDGADHFDLDHSDTFCEGKYSNLGELQGLTRKEKRNKILSVNIEVTQHTGGESDRWLLHEVDKGFRTSLGIPGDAYWQRKINGQSILESGAGGRTYRWVSGNKVINIEYTDAQITKPEPLEVVQAYLAKFPSTIEPVNLQQLRSSENVIKWIKDEMDRRLWLCDKWNAEFQAGQAIQKDLLYNLNRSVGVFLNYRQKYYGVSAKSDLEALFGYKQKTDIASIQKKLTEYKVWWAKHKDERISLK